MQIHRLDFDQVLANIIPLLRRRRRVIYAAVLATAGAAFLFYASVGERYEVYTLLRIGQGIKERPANSSPFGDGIDLSSRIKSLARITTTDLVIRQATMQVGVDRMTTAKKTTLLAAMVNAVGSKLRQFPQTPAFAGAGTDQAEALDETTIRALRDRILAKQEGRSDLLRISFRDVDAPAAAAFVNALTNSLVSNYADLTQVPGAGSFFQQQTWRLEAEAEKAAADLQAFSVSASIYAVTDQRTLLLKRADELSSKLASTRASIEEHKGQKQVLTDQLMLLRPVAQSKTVTGIVKNLGGRDYRPGETAAKDTAPAFDDMPPLLLVRVYQDNMAALMKLNAELAGAFKMETTLAAEIEHVNADLATLSAKEAEYNRLRRALARASAAAENYGTRMVEEQINADITKQTQLSSVRIVETAERPITPVFPQIAHLVALVLIGGLGSGAAISVILERTQTRASSGRITEFNRRPARRNRIMLRAAE